MIQDFQSSLEKLGIKTFLIFTINLLNILLFQRTSAGFYKQKSADFFSPSKQKKPKNPFFVLGLVSWSGNRHSSSVPVSSS